MKTGEKKTGEIQNCLGCHFLAWEYTDASDGQRTLESMPRRDRQQLIMFDSGWRLPSSFDGVDSCTVFCHRQVWDSLTSAIPVDLAAKREEQCFFYRHVPALDLATAVELEGRAADRREAEKDRALSRHMLKLTFWALVVTIAFSCGNLVWEFTKYLRNGGQ